MIIKAISLWEPWASLIRAGLKRYETRHWKTNYRGPLLICAAVAARFTARELRHMIGGMPDDFEMHFGHAVAIVDLVDCIPTETMTPELIGTDAPFGNFDPCRFAWKLENLQIIKPFPAKGRQGLFNVDVSDLVIIKPTSPGPTQYL